MLAIAVAPEGRVKEYILNAWDEIDRNYRINFISSNSASAVPHITLLAGIDEIFGDNLIGIIKKIAIDSTPFGMHSNGLGMLLLDSPLIYLRWKENIALHSLRNRILNKLELNGIPCKNKAYNFEWMAKTTICFQDTNYDSNLLKTINTLKTTFEFSYKSTIKNLMVIKYSEGESEETVSVFRLDK